MNTIKTLSKEITSFDRYLSGDLKVIGLDNYPNSDSIVSEHFSFSEWLIYYKKYPIIKVEGIEKVRSILKQYKNFDPKDIHLFVSQKTGHSFRWHRDNVNVYLHVIKGKKIVRLKNQTFILKKGQGVHIPKRSLHKVFSVKDTWALSIGY